MTNGSKSQLVKFTNKLLYYCRHLGTCMLTSSMNIYLAGHIATTNARGNLRIINDNDNFHAKTKATKAPGKTCISEQNRIPLIVVWFYFCHLRAWRASMSYYIIIVIYVDINKGIEASHIHWSWNHADQKIIFFFFLSVTETKWSFVLLYLFVIVSRPLYNHTILIWQIQMFLLRLG